MVFEDRDCMLHRNLLAERCRNAGVVLWAYCPMPNASISFWFRQWVQFLEISGMIRVWGTMRRTMSPMDDNEKKRKEALLRQYAAGEIAWHELRECGFDNYIEVLGGLGELGLRPPIAPMEGPNRAARERGRAIIREALKGRS
jgi:hypothetical protein